jgi:hypothetical protein
MFNIITLEQEKHLKTLPMPIVPLKGLERNACGYSLIFQFEDAAKKAGWIKKDIDLVMEEMKSNKYHHLLIVCQEFTKESEHEDGKRIIDLCDDYDFIARGGCEGEDF